MITFRMDKLVFCSVLSALCFTTIVPQKTEAEESNPNKELSEVVSMFKKNPSGRYMFSKEKCKPERSIDWPGYENLPDGSLQRCEYEVTSCVTLIDKEKKKICELNRDPKYTAPKVATVVLLEPGIERFARWIVSACAEVGGNRSGCLKSLFDLGWGSSNWQIPIAGIVYEAMDSTKWVEAGFAFRDGLTVRADTSCGWKNGRDAGGERPPTQNENSQCSRPNAMPQAVSYKARPMATQQFELIDWGKDENTKSVPKHKEGEYVEAPNADPWRKYVRETFVKAFSAENNPLVTAKAFVLHTKKAF